MIHADARRAWCLNAICLPKHHFGRRFFAFSLYIFAVSSYIHIAELILILTIAHFIRRIEYAQ